MSVQRKLHHMVDVLRRKRQNGRMEHVFVFLLSSPSIFVGENGTAREDDRRRMDELTTKIYACWLHDEFFCKKGPPGSNLLGRKH